MPAVPKEDLENENENLRNQLKALQDKHAQGTNDLDAMKTKMVKLTRQLDDEVTKRDQIQSEANMMERKLQESKMGAASSPVSAARNHDKSGDRDAKDTEARERGSHASTKLMRVVDQWMRQRDLQQALLRGASVNDTGFSTLVQALADCPSLQTLDLSQNLLTMDSCSDLCQLITTAPSLSFISLADNLFSLRSVGYFMTAVMERQNTKKLMPLDLLDLQGNEGLITAVNAPVPDAMLKQVQASLGGINGKLPPKGAEIIVQVMRSLWRFLHDTAHPQVRNTSADDVAFNVMDKTTIRKMENALMKMLMQGVAEEDTQCRPVTANLAFAALLDAPQGDSREPTVQGGTTSGSASEVQRGGSTSAQSALPPAPARGGGYTSADGSTGALSPAQRQQQEAASKSQRSQLADPFSDLKQAFEPPKEKLKTFNLKQIVTRNGTVLMNMLERLLETTEIDAHDVETDQTLLEYACQTGNMSLAKLCYRRGANLSAKTRKGDTAFNIVTKNKRYDMMEFLHLYGVRIDSSDATGRTALHVAAIGNDVDAVCRLLEWGADVNNRDNKKQTPIHYAASGGNMEATMLLLEVGADMNAKDEREYTAVAHAEAKNHFALMDRLVQLGGQGHGLQKAKGNAGATHGKSKQVGELVITDTRKLKSSSLGRIGKVAVTGMPGPLSPTSGK